MLWPALLTFLVSFCSMSYQLIAVKAFYFYPNDVLQQCLTLGVYLLFLGLGAYKIDTSKQNNDIRKFIKIESALTFLGAFSISLINLILIFTDFILPLASFDLLGLFAAQTVVALIGYISGQEIPLLIKIFESKTNFNKILGISYFGGLLGSLLVPLYLIPIWGTYMSTFIIGMTNLFVLILFIVKHTKGPLPQLISLGVAVATVGTLGASKKIDTYLTKVKYAGVRVAATNWADFKLALSNVGNLEEIEQYRTKYQIIDIVPETFFSQFGKKDSTTLYLNHKPQFSTNNWRTYHESFYFAGVSLTQQHPENVLILGGGDGILANLIHKHSPTTKITLVELDEQIVKIAKHHQAVTGLNNNIFRKDVVQLHIKDAIQFLKNNTTKYDAIYIDFPVPVTFTLSKLYSVEFYKLVGTALSDNGYFVFDAPLFKDLTPFMLSEFKNSHALFSTLSFAGYHNLLFFGPSDPFIFVSKSQRELKFNYDVLESYQLFTKTLVNLTPILDIKTLGVAQTKNANFLFAPKLLEY